MDLPDRRKAERVGKGEIEENGVEASFIDVRQPVGQSLGVGHLEFFHAPFGQQVLSQAGIDVVIFDQQDRNHAKNPID